MASSVSGFYCSSRSNSVLWVVLEFWHLYNCCKWMLALVSRARRRKLASKSNDLLDCYPDNTICKWRDTKMNIMYQSLNSIITQETLQQRFLSVCSRRPPFMSSQFLWYPARVPVYQNLVGAFQNIPIFYLEKEKHV